MNWRSTSGLMAAFLFILSFANAQSTCTYRLELFDSRGDGWSNASVRLTINGSPSVYTLDGFNDNGSFRAFDIPVRDGDTVSLTYVRGFAEAENSYAIYDPEGKLIFSDGPRPNAGTLFAVRVTCPSCPAPVKRTISVDDVRSRRADVSWMPTDPEGRYIIEYDTAGFLRGRGRRLEARGGEARLTGLKEKTKYEFYLSVICSSGDTSIVQGPFAFETLWTKDVGISRIVSPVTACGLGDADTVRVALTNFGGDPQTLVPFNYSVNGKEAGVPFPFDGLFTGVVGNDSTAIIEFETTYNFSEPGEYVLSAWTYAEKDQEVHNDTTTVTITNIPIISAFPYFEDFEEWGGGWTVDTNSRRPSWAYGKPVGAIIDRAAGGKGAWVTNLGGPYNRGELSYLVSPCLDFSSLRQDPRLSFSLFFFSEECCDRGWVELSTDGGENWRKVGSAGSGLNWYSDATNQAWAGDITGKSWVYAYNTLSGTAGAADVRIRFVFASDNLQELEGFAIDNVFISTPLANDLASVNAVNLSTQECGASNDRIRLTINNFGTRSQTGFNVGYRVNGGPAVVENVGNLQVAPGQQANYTFSTPFNSSGSATYEILAWTSLNSEEFRGNDTIRYVFSTSRTLPFAEDFESRISPKGWNTGDGVINNQRGNSSYVLSDNLYVGDRDFSATTPVVGPVAAGDTLKLDYRFVLQAGNGNNPKVLTAGEKLEVQISIDCGQSYQTVLTRNETNHTPSAKMATLAIPLTAYTGKNIKVRFIATWVTGDFWIDLDNINIRRCPASLQLATDVKNESAAGARNGSVTVAAGAGIGPFTYAWSNGDSTRTILRLPAGEYTVTVSDRYGCAQTLTVEVGIGTAVEDIRAIRELRLAPNPTTGRSRLQLALYQPAEVQVQVYSLMGQLLIQGPLQRVDRYEEELDLSAYTDGLYLLRIVVDRQVHTEKLLLVR